MHLLLIPAPSKPLLLLRFIPELLDTSAPLFDWD
jgi:hypothetical protein